MSFRRVETANCLSCGSDEAPLVELTAQGDCLCPGCIDEVAALVGGGTRAKRSRLERQTGDSLRNAEELRSKLAELRLESGVVPVAEALALLETPN